MQINRGIAPLIILAIIALLAIGTGSAVYVSKAKHATSTPAVAVVPKNESKTFANSISQVTTTPATGTDAVGITKTGSNTDTKTKAQPVTAVSPTTKPTTKSSFVIPATPSIQASEVKTFKQALTYGRDLVCTFSGPMGLYNRQGIYASDGKSNIEYYFSPSFPGIYAVAYHSHSDNPAKIASNLELQMFDWNKYYFYNFRVEGDADPTWDTIRSTPGRVSSESELSSKEFFTPSALNDSMMRPICAEQTFDHAILDTTKYTYGKSYDYYLKSGKDWECTSKDEFGEGGTRFSHLYPTKWYTYNVNYATPGYPERKDYHLVDLIAKREYGWTNLSALYSYDQWGYCRVNGTLLPNVIKNCVEKPQDPSLFELPKDQKFTLSADYSGFCK